MEIFLPLFQDTGKRPQLDAEVAELRFTCGKLNIRNPLYSVEIMAGIAGRVANDTIIEIPLIEKGTH